MNSDEMDAKILASETAYSGFFELRRLTVEHDRFAGGTTGHLTREVLHRSNVAAAILYDPNVDKVVLIEEYRAGAHVAGVNPWMIDIVAGRIESGKTAFETVSREIGEESGLTPSAIELIGIYLTAPHLSSEKVHLYFATVDAARVIGTHGLAHEDEDIRPVALARSDALSLQKSRPLSLWAGLALNWLENRLHFPSG
ncbi:MAG: NUDIX domain-containing protein [Georgfuchsia sp.]